MPHVITAPCVSTRDRSCVTACPVDCIHEADGHLFIDPGRCVDCGACVPACPVSAIFPGARVPSEWADWTARNAALARARVADRRTGNGAGR